MVQERELGAGLPPGTGRGRRSIDRRAAYALVLLLVAAGVLAALSVVPALAMRDRLERGRGLLLRAQASLLRGDVEEAAGAFERARREFQQASAHPGAVLLRLEALLPFLGRTPDALLGITDIGRKTSEAGAEVAEAIARMPGGLSALGPEGNRIPVRELRTLSPAVTRASSTLQAAKLEADALPESWLPAPLDEARDVVREKLDRAAPLARSAAALLRTLPSFAGQDRPRRYFVGAQNSTELRGTGGLIGNYSILTIDRGRISLGDFDDASSLANLPAEEVQTPSEDFARLYNPFGGGGFWLNINMTPDAPTAATLIESLYRRVEGERLDGTILFDLQGLSDILRFTGPVRSDALRFTLTAKNVIPYVAEARYLDAPVPQPRRNGPRLVAESVWGRFLGQAEPEQAMRTLVEAAAGGHLILHSVEPEVQRAFRLAGVAGELGPPPGSDFFGVALSNAAGNKVDYYLEEDLRYTVKLMKEGAARSQAVVRLHNDAPAGARPSYALGPHYRVRVDGRKLLPGENRSWISFYCSARCVLEKATLDGREMPLEAHREKGLRVFAGFVEVKPQRTREIRLSLRSEDVWDGDSAVGSYRLRVQGQAMIRPTTADVRVVAPDGTSVASNRTDGKVRGPTLRWRGELGRKQDLEADFSRPFWGRVWARTWDLLTRPVIQL